MKARSQIIVVAITMAILSPVSRGKEPTHVDPKRPRQSESTHEELNTVNLILAKEFCVALRRKDYAAMRRMIDPEYLKRLELGEHDRLPIQIAPVSGIHNIIVAEDRNTVLCLYSTVDGTKEAMLLRTTRKEARTFVLPPTPVDPTTGLFTPWSLSCGSKSLRQRYGISVITGLAPTSELMLEALCKDHSLAVREHSDACLTLQGANPPLLRDKDHAYTGSAPRGRNEWSSSG